VCSSDLILSASNSWTHVRWVDEKIPGLLFGSNPSANPPSRIQVEPNSGIYGLGWEHDDTASFTLQWAHGAAATNAGFLDFYYDPHLHVSCTNITSGSNVTFSIKYQIAWPNSTYTTVGPITNSVTITNVLHHALLAFGPITNNLLQSHDSIVTRGQVTRLDSGASDVGSGPIVIIDSMDFHIPIDNVGSYNMNGGD